MDRRAYGPSKWASLQFTEKLMKSRLASSSVAFPKNHKLDELSRLLTTIGSNVGKRDLDEIQCPAGVRYGDVSVDRDSALRAHIAALRVAWSLGYGDDSVAKGCP
jgi:hypothetical protein